MRLVVVIVLLLLLTEISHAAENTAADFLTTYADARPSALGGAYTALSDDAAAMSFNSAGLVQAKSKEITVSYSPWIGDGAYHHVSYTHPTFANNEAFGLSLLYFDAGSFLQTNELGITNGFKLEAVDFAVTGGYARTLTRNLSVGASAKYIRRRLSVHVANALAFDLGAIYRLPIKNLTIGAAIQNMGTRLHFIEEREPLPLTFRAGFSYQTLLERLFLVADVVKVVDESRKYSVGAEIRVVNEVRLRAGWQSDDSLSQGLTLGAGMSVKGITLDYAYIPFDIFESAHRITGSVQFGGPTTPDVYRMPMNPPITATTPPPESMKPAAIPEVRVTGADTVPVRIRILK